MDALWPPSPKSLHLPYSLFSSQIHLKSCSYVVSVVWISLIEGCQRFSKGFGLKSYNGRRLVTEEWRFETSFHGYGEGFSSLLAAVQIGKRHEMSPRPSVGLIHLTLQPWLGRSVGCETWIRYGLFLVGIQKSLSCEDNGWRIYQNFHTGKSLILNSDTMLWTMSFRWIYAVFGGFVNFWIMIIHYGVGLVHYFGVYLVSHKVVRNLEEDLKTCFIVIEIGEEGRGVKMRLDFGVFTIRYGAQTLFNDDELRAKETTPESCTEIQEIAKADDHVEDHPRKA
ncbi:hypothetical protein V6N11_010562 [Hibiscus sabdariffa]|uniref:Uncharacterized protein n=1 Tax=Hibiscus sabdariffa TaxID=183260 RepID=A0ABR2S6H5_9ROSI